MCWGWLRRVREGCSERLQRQCGGHVRLPWDRTRTRATGPARTRAAARASDCCAIFLCAVVMGCAHRQQVPPLAPQAKTPNIYVAPPPETKLPPMQSEETPPNLTDAKPVPAAEEKPKKRTKRQQPASVTALNPPQSPPPVEQPAAPSTAPATLGALAPGGGNADPRQQQEVMAKIGAVEKRINDLPSATADREQKQIAKVRQFLKEASDAWKGGDVEGAGILATKADLLMDDLTK